MRVVFCEQRDRLGAPEERVTDVADERYRFCCEFMRALVCCALARLQRAAQVCDCDGATSERGGGMQGADLSGLQGFEITHLARSTSHTHTSNDFSPRWLPSVRSLHAKLFCLLGIPSLRALAPLAPKSRHMSPTNWHPVRALHSAPRPALQPPCAQKGAASNCKFFSRLHPRQLANSQVKRARHCLQRLPDLYIGFTMRSLRVNARMRASSLLRSASVRIWEQR